MKLLCTILATAALVTYSAGQNVAERMRPLQILTLQTRTAHVQGIDTDGVHLWVTSVETATRKGFLQEFRLQDGGLERSIEVQDGKRFHPGGISADGDSLWIPVAEYRPHSSAIIQKRNKQTLALEFQFTVPDHIGCLAVTPDSLIAGNWDNADFYVWDHTGKLQRKVPSTSGNGYQDLKFRAGQLMASGLFPDKHGALDWLELPSLKLQKRLLTGNTDRGQPFTREGMTVFHDRLYFLPEDGESRLFIFEAPH